MILRLKEYTGPFRIVSLALDEISKKSLYEANVPFIYTLDDAIILWPKNEVLCRDIKLVEILNQMNNFDVFEIWENGIMHQKYSDSSDDNYFFVTGMCNSNCIMCPSPAHSRMNQPEANIGELIELASHIPSDTPHLTITGGEPFMVGEKLFPFLSYLKQKFCQTEFLLLTNGRIFSIEKYWRRFLIDAPSNILVGIPLHGSNARIHDAITRASGSFDQTVKGIRTLLKHGVHIELRLVVNRLNMDDFSEIADFILRHLKGIEYVSIIAMEMTGNARIHSEQVWIPYRKAFNSVKEAINILLKSGIDVKLYNFPLCTVDKQFWPMCSRSISSYKVRFEEECASCKYKNDCGGVFAGTIDMERGELKAIL